MLKSISKELIICRKEKDEFKLMAEQLGEKCSLMKRRIERLNSLKGQNDDEMNFGSLDDYNQLVLSQNYKKLQDSNKLLNFELNDLRIKLSDAESDCRLLREKLGKLKKRNANYSDNIIDNISGEFNDRQQTKHLIQQIEKLKMKNKELEKDLKLHLDEREDLIKSRNSYVQKADRLNERLNALMNGDDASRLDQVNNEGSKLDSSLLDSSLLDRAKKSTSDQFLDIDSILSENKFLKEKLACVEQDKMYNQEMITKYKHVLDKASSNKKNFFELSHLTNKKSNKPGDSLNYLNQDIVSTREIQSFIASNNLDNLELNEATLLKLKKLVLILFESVSDKSAALNLAKNNNKLFGKRINDLDAKLKKYENREKHLRIETLKLKLDEDDKLDEFDKSSRQSTSDLDKNDSNKNDLGGLESDVFGDELSKDERVKLRLKDDEILNSGELTEDENRNIIETRLEHSDLINLPNNLQRLVERELERLKDV